MIRTLADVSLTIFVWYVLLKQLYVVARNEWQARKRRKNNASHLREIRYNTRVQLHPGLSSDIYVAKCPHCNIAWPVKSKDDPTFLNHPKATDPYHCIDCEGSGKLCEGKLWNNNEYPYREAIAEFKRAGAAAVCGPLDGEPKVMVPPSDAPLCLREAFWSGCTSDYLDPSESRRHWDSARELFAESQRLSTKVTCCPKCGKEGESNREDTELVCPHCGHTWSTNLNVPLTPGGFPTYNHSRGDSPLTPCPQCAAHPMHKVHYE